MSVQSIAYTYGFQSGASKNGCKAVFVKDPKYGKDSYTNVYIGRCDTSELDQINDTDLVPVYLTCPVSSSFSSNMIDTVRCSSRINNDNLDLRFITYTRSENKKYNTRYVSSWMIDKSDNEYYQEKESPLMS